MIDRHSRFRRLGPPSLGSIRRASVTSALDFVLIAGAAISVLSGTSMASEEVRFNTDIRPIFAEHCVACHGGVKQASELSFVYHDNVLAGGESGAPAVVPGDVEASYLIDRVTDPDPESRMPPADHGPPLSADEIDRLRKWIAEGAEWEKPWAFMPPREWPLPEVERSEWCLKPLDNFVLDRLESAGIAPEAPAERVEWLRRVSFDLIGLPPTLKEVEAFEKDEEAQAFERVVDRLLASPHFGERWAAMWLDLARYADTTGYEADPHRDIWPYRDWVIRAFNADMPYDEFTIKQLAGDLLEEPTLDDRLATALHRNTQMNTEGGTDDEEFRVAAVIDRVNTTWQVWQATTFGCIQCHAHPYDPIRHEEYYQFMALFNNTRDADIDEDLPRIDVPLDTKDFEEREQIGRRISHLRRVLHERVKPLAEDSTSWQNLNVDRAESTGNTRLEIRPVNDPASGAATEVVAEGAVTVLSVYTLEAPIPSGIEEIATLRIDAPLGDAEAARRTPEMGFVLSQLKASILPAGGGEAVAVPLKHAFCDEAEPLLDPARSLDADDWGWASYSRQWRPRYAVFLLEKPLAVSPGSRIRIELDQKRNTSGDVSLAMRRSRYSVSPDRRWTELQESREFVAAQQELTKLTKRAAEIKSLSVPVMSELPEALRRSTFVFTRGLWLDKGEEVEPDTPDVLPPLPQGAEHNRLTMARWLVSRENPLTARVLVNRVWAQLFGTGIVETEEDFGTSGTLPSHPELLDHLALRFQNEHGWRLKSLLRELVLSATYRQSARITPEKLAADPQNRLLSRGPRMRLSAEMIRDQALVVSGRFAPKMFGPPVMPPQPEGIWRSVYSNAKWVNATGPDRYRRAIYTYWKRTSAYPSMVTFDMPSREVCTMRRIPTNTPLQALVTLNDEAYVECASGLAERMMADGGATAKDRIAWAYRAATGRAPDASTLDDLVRLYENAQEHVSTEPEASKHLGSTTEHASLTVVASAILNLDEMLTK
jgi:hypothetical protein